MKSCPPFISVILLSGLPWVSGARGLVDDVDVFVGTSISRWMLFPGATLPFGLVKLSPDNQGNVWNGGYASTVSSIPVKPATFTVTERNPPAEILI